LTRNIVLFMKTINNYITKDKDYCRGMARLEGTRLPVAHIIFLQNEGDSLEAIINAYNITKEQIKAANEYYKNNKEEIDKDIYRLNNPVVFE